eukprot:CAMPEP_0181176430 /NCGR_PEP_ID=MMETSP1096-20121128/4626_1 /TAXON_ID=156174 ORGANISM="Chrysochromulina ericina, Strain CCMP281" /NCGR_SAMPLE_ID=MMETSP1096 /ASSEMBLY_ACC=CAM_ASM_000453 /LENGTH=59 /DNA_ID=CAMNT_0023264519 /DNA_START=543 /DNA_END=722 /DNA_ORIENTATION=-
MIDQIGKDTLDLIDLHLHPTSAETRSKLFDIELGRAHRVQLVYASKEVSVHDCLGALYE